MNRRPGRKEAADRRAAEREEAALRKSGARFLTRQEVKAREIERRTVRHAVLDGRWIWPHTANK